MFCLPLVPYPLVLFLSKNLGEDSSRYCCCSCQAKVKSMPSPSQKLLDTNLGIQDSVIFSHSGFIWIWPFSSNQAKWSVLSPYIEDPPSQLNGQIPLFSFTFFFETVTYTQFKNKTLWKGIKILAVSDDLIKVNFINECPSPLSSFLGCTSDGKYNYSTGCSKKYLQDCLNDISDYKNATHLRHISFER